MSPSLYRLSYPGKCYLKKIVFWLRGPDSNRRSRVRGIMSLTSNLESVYILKEVIFWLRGPDSNRRPSGYEPDELPTALPRVA